MEIVKNLNTLKAMAKRGLVEFCDQTGFKIRGLYSRDTFTCYYVWEGKDRFEYKGQSYGIKYFDGCFYPYVVKLD